MNSSINRFSLDIHSAQSQISIPVMQYDTGRTFRINLSDGGNPYIITDGCLAKISFKRPTGTHIEEFCTIDGNTTIVYHFDQNENTAAVEGIHNCDVTLYGLDGKSIASPKFTMVVSEKVINSDDITITDNDRTVVDAMVKAEAVRQAAETGRNDAEAVRVSAEAERIANEEKRLNTTAMLLHAAGQAVEAKTASQASAEAAKDSEVKAKESETTATNATNIATEQAQSASTSANESASSASEARVYMETAQQIASEAIMLDVRSMDSRISRNSKRITNLEQGIIPDPFETDATVAYTKDVPSAALPYAELRKVGGMTHKAKNLIRYPYVLSGTGTTSSGITYSVLADGGIKVQGTSAGNADLVLNNYAGLKAGTYTIPYIPKVIIGVLAFSRGSWAKDIGYMNGSTKTFSISQDDVNNYEIRIILRVPNATPVDTVVYPMINEGTSALPWELYYEGLKDAAVTEIKSIGANLIPRPYYSETRYGKTFVTNGVTFTVNDDGSITANGTATSAALYYLTEPRSRRTSGETYSISGDVDGVIVQGSYSPDDQSGTKYLREGTHTLEAGSVYWYLQVRSGTTVNCTVYPMITKSLAPLPYAPYVEHTFPIPAEVQALDGYGQSNPDNPEQFNYIDFDALTFNAVGNIVDGAWVEFDTLIVTDISNLLTFDNFIEVEGYGSIKAVNENELAAPTEITYQLKGVTS